MKWIEENPEFLIVLSILSLIAVGIRVEKFYTLKNNNLKIKFIKIKEVKISNMRCYRRKTGKRCCSVDINYNFDSNNYIFKGISTDSILFNTASRLSRMNSPEKSDFYSIQSNKNCIYNTIGTNKAKLKKMFIEDYKNTLLNDFCYKRSPKVNLNVFPSNQ